MCPEQSRTVRDFRRAVQLAASPECELGSLDAICRELAARLPESASLPSCLGPVTPDRIRAWCEGDELVPLFVFRVVCRLARVRPTAVMELEPELDPARQDGHGPNWLHE
jgi:hypothetical protein